MARGSYATGDVPIIRVPVQSGAFVVCRSVGGLSDPSTGLHFAGPKARVDEVTREVVELFDFPEPIQLPTSKWSPNPKDLSEYLEIDFFDNDSVMVHDFIRMALDVGTLDVVPDEVVKECYPKAWANRREWCFEVRSNVRDKAKVESLADLYEAARNAHLREAREAHRETDADAKAAAEL